MINVGQRITQLREAQGLTVNKLANLSGISQSHLREIELGNKNPTVETLSYFCESLNITLSDFFKESDDNITPVLLKSMRKLSEQQQLILADFINSIEE